MRLTRDEISRLTPAERLEIIDQLWSSLDTESVPVTEEQKAELERRMVTLEQDKLQAVTWLELKAELERRYP